MINCQSLNAFPLRSGTRQEYPSLLFLLNIALEVLASSIMQEKGRQNIQIGKENAKLSLFTDDMIENPKTLQKFLE